MRWRQIGKAKTYCDLTLEWDYKLHTCELTLPAYIEKMLLCFHHLYPIRPHDYLILQPPLNLIRRHRKWPLRTTPPSLTKMKNKRFNKLSAASSLMQEWLTIPYPGIGRHHMQAVSPGGVNRKMGRASVRLCCDISKCRNKIPREGYAAHNLQWCFLP